MLSNNFQMTDASRVMSFLQPSFLPSGSLLVQLSLVHPFVMTLFSQGSPEGKRLLWNNSPFPQGFLPGDTSVCSCDRQLCVQLASLQNFEVSIYIQDEQACKTNHSSWWRVTDKDRNQKQERLFSVWEPAITMIWLKTIKHSKFKERYTETFSLQNQQAVEQSLSCL